MTLAEDANATSAPPTNGLPSCPCMQAWEVPPPTEADGSLLATIEGQIFPYPPRYGLGECKAHDLDTMPYCDVASPPDWCSRSWCYVSLSRCSAIYEVSQHFGSGYHFSYATCTANTQFENPIVWPGRANATNATAPIDALALGCPRGQARTRASALSAADEICDRSRPADRTNAPIVASREDATQRRLLRVPPQRAVQGPSSRSAQTPSARVRRAPRKCRRPLRMTPLSVGRVRVSCRVRSGHVSAKPRPGGVRAL